MKFNNLFSGGNRKISTTLSSVELAKKVVNVKALFFFNKKNIDMFSYFSMKTYVEGTH